MGLIIVNYAGQALENLNVSDIRGNNPTKNAIIQLPGLDKDSVQNFGKSNRKFTITGIINALDSKVFLMGMMNNTGSIYFEYTNDVHLIELYSYITSVRVGGDFDSTDFYFEDFYTGDAPITEKIDAVNVFYYNLEFRDLGNRPLERAYKFDAIEVI